MNHVLVIPQLQTNVALVRKRLRTNPLCYEQVTTEWRKMCDQGG
jgi:hypothetical protein